MINNQRGQFSLKLVQKCPVCNNDYHEGRVEILAEGDFGFLAYLTCSVCFSNILIKVMTMPHGMIGNAILTDLSAIEVMRFAAVEDLESDSVLEFHQLINKDSSFIEKLK
jgi:hypothetical protein